MIFDNLSILNVFKHYTIYSEYDVSMYHDGEEVSMTSGYSLSIDPENFAQAGYYNMMFNDVGSNWANRDVNIENLT